jgi:hypothetical protein
MLVAVFESVPTDSDNAFILYVKEFESTEFVIPTTFSNASIASLALACCAACPDSSSVERGLARLSLLAGKLLAMLPPGDIAFTNYILFKIIIKIKIYYYARSDII